MTSARSALMVLTIFAGLMIAGCVSKPKTVDFLVENITIYTGVGGSPFIGTIAIHDGKFIAVSSLDGTSFTSAQAIDGTGKFAVPGLWDAHVHVRSTLNSDLDTQRFLRFGVTSIQDLGGHMNRIKELEEKMDLNPAAGPTVYPVYFMLNGESFAPFQRVVSTEQEASDALAELATAGAVRIKVPLRFSGGPAARS